MASSKEYLRFILEQLSDLDDISYRSMMGEYILYYTIVGGVPAKPIRCHFDDTTIEKLEALRWWDWDYEKIKYSIPAIQSGDLAALEDVE